MKDGIPQFNFLSGMNGNPGGGGGGMQQPTQMGESHTEGGLTMHLPMPTPISTMQNANNQPQQQHAMMNSVSAHPPPAPPQQVMEQQQNTTPLAPDNSQQAQQQALAATFAQFLAQHTGALFQQQQQQQQRQQQQQQQQMQQMQQQQMQQQRAPQQQQQIQQHTNNPNQGQMAQQLMQPNRQQPAVPMQQQQQQQAQNQTQLQLPFTADPNTFLQQLQFAQLQQQLQLAQQQAQQQQSQQQAQPQVPQQTSQRKRNATSANAASQGRPPLPIAPTGARATGQPPTKKSRSAKITRPPATKKDGIDTKSRSKKAKAGIVSASDTDADAPKRSKKKTPPPSNASVSGTEDGHEDKAQANRDRNREHARNTRLRKKAYLEKLKATVDELCKERDTLVSERAGAANLLVEMHNTRTEVLMSFFALRSTNEKRRKLWSSILDESRFTCIMPVTPYRSFPASEVQVSKCQRTILGIDAMMADTSSLHVLFSSLVDRTKYPEGKIDFRYTLVTEESVVAGNQMMARWVMSTTNATELGARMEVAKQGMLCCKFNSAHRIIGLELMFDVMAFMLQLKQAAGSENFPVIPNTVQTCQRLFDKPMVLTLAEPPYTIVQVNKLWEEMTGYSAEEVVGKASCKILQGPSTDRKNLDELMQEVRFKRPYATILSNVKKSGQIFRHSLVVFPLSTDSRITHYLALSTQHLCGGPKSDQAIAPTQTQPTTISLKQPPQEFNGGPQFNSQTSFPSTQSNQQAQNPTGIPHMLMNRNPTVLMQQPTPMPNFSLSMAPPPCRK